MLRFLLISLFFVSNVFAFEKSFDPRSQILTITCGDGSTLSCKIPIKQGNSEDCDPYVGTKTSTDLGIAHCKNRGGFVGVKDRKSEFDVKQGDTRSSNPGQALPPKKTSGAKQLSN